MMEKAYTLLDNKAHDYATPNDLHSNFKYSDMVSSPFYNPYKSYAVLVGVKLARLSQVLQDQREVKNESIEDSFIDLINYVALMYERYKLEKRAQTL